MMTMYWKDSAGRQGWRKLLLKTLLLSWLPLLASAQEAWTLPPAMESRIAALDEAQQRFIRDGDFLTFMPARQMELLLSERDEASLQQMLSELMAVAEEMGYDATRDMGAIPLNTASKMFNQGVIPPMALRKEDREPGPFSVHRYLFPASGVPTFAGAPVAIWPEDLKAGQVDVAIVGIPNDMSSGRRNAKFGPRAMRALNTLALPDVATLVDPMVVLSVVDYGDFAVDNMSTERTVAHVTAMVAETSETGAVPMMVGGDTSMLYPGVKGVAQVHGEGSFGLVHFSAHPDVDREGVHTLSDDQAIFLLLRDGIVQGQDLITVGLRGPALTLDTLEWLRSQGVRYHTMAEINRHGYPAVMQRVLSEVEGLPEQLFVSVDVSVIQPTDMVAAGRLQPGGLSIQELASTLRQLCASRDIVGFEITDLAPMLDVSRLSAVNANTALNACLTGMAARRAGFAADEIHPLALDHGQE